MPFTSLIRLYEGVLLAVAKRNFNAGTINSAVGEAQFKKQLKVKLAVVCYINWTLINRRRQTERINKRINT